MIAASRIETGVELPGSGGGVFYYPGATTEGGAFADGLLVRVSARNGKRWYAMCRGGHLGAEGIFEFESDPSRFVIVYGGAGYCISYDDPQAWENLPFNGFARYAIPVRDADMLLLFDWISGAAYGPHGVVWKTPRLFLDGLEVVACDAQHVTLSGHDLGEPFQIILDVRDGHFVSGQPSRFN